MILARIYCLDSPSFYWLDMSTKQAFTEYAATLLFFFLPQINELNRKFKRLGSNWKLPWKYVILSMRIRSYFEMIYPVNNYTLLVLSSSYYTSLYSFPPPPTILSSTLLYTLFYTPPYSPLLLHTLHSPLSTLHSPSPSPYSPLLHSILISLPLVQLSASFIVSNFRSFTPVS